MPKPNHKPKKKPDHPAGDDEGAQAYGYVLVLRAISSFAIRFPERGGALRVLCVMSDYMDQDGKCYVGQSAIADRLKISRVAVNKHLSFLESTETIFSYAHRGAGKTKVYVLDTDHVADEREGQEDVNRGRSERRAARRKTSPEDVAADVQPGADPVSEFPETETDPLECNAFAAGTRVRHPKFGLGDVSEVDGNKLTIMFEHAGEKRVVDSFVERA